MRNSVFYLFVFALLTSCSSEKVNPIGTYKNESSNIVQKGYQFVFHKSMCTLNNTLIIKKDSTFEYSNCGGINMGTWKVKDDSVLLVIDTFKSSVDSIPIWNYEKNQRVMGFKINGDVLFSREPVKILSLDTYDMLNWVNSVVVKVKKVKS